MKAAVLGIDGGNSKADVVLVSADGTLLAALRNRTISHQAIGLKAGMSRLEALVRQAAAAAAEAGGDALDDVESGGSHRELVAEIAVASLAGADYLPDIRLLTNAIEARGLSRRTVVVNDTIGALRAGALRPWGVVLVNGQGVNAAAIAPNGRTARFPAVGDIAGDWGGGGSVGMAGLQAAIRGRDGRGPRTSLERSVPAHFGLARPASVTRAIYDGRIAENRVGELSPVVFGAAQEGDVVARAIIDRLATELVAMAGALIRRLRITRQDLEVVLAGGVFRTDDVAFYAAIEEGIRTVAPRAKLVRLRWPPVVGAALLGLDMLAGGDAGLDVAARLRASIGAWDREITGANGFK
jgi:N-acetylglucosamine kinase-like BadF-type ATPase